MTLTAWILAGALVAALLTALLLWRALRRRARSPPAPTSSSQRLARRYAQHPRKKPWRRRTCLRVAISRAHADSISTYVTEERRFSDQRRGELSVRERELSERLAEMVAVVEQRAEERLRAWEADLERAQRALEGEVTVLEQFQRQRICRRRGTHRG